MRNVLTISSLALAAAMLAGGAGAQTLNLGGLSVDLGSTGNSGASFDLDTGGDSSPDVSVSLGSGAASAAGPAALSVDLGDSSDADAAVGIDLNDDDGDGILGLGGRGSGGLGLFGPGNAPDVAVGGEDLVDLDNNGDDDVNLALFGDGATDATVTLGDTDLDFDVGGAGGSGIDGLFGDVGSGDVALDLFGNGLVSGIGDDLGLDLDLAGVTETSDTAIDPDRGNGGFIVNPPGESIRNGGSTLGSGSDADAAIRVAAVPRAGNCFSPDARQITHLLQSRDYDAAMSARWSSAREVDLVPVRLCPEARARVVAAIAADADIQWLQDAVERDARIAARLHRAGLDGDNVLALDSKPGKVAVYVF
jgi:hypothetical protein